METLIWEIVKGKLILIMMKFHSNKKTFVSEELVYGFSIMLITLQQQALTVN